MGNTFGNTGLQESASRVMREQSLYAAKIPSAYAAGWQYRKLNVVAQPISLAPLVENTSKTEFIASYPSLGIINFSFETDALGTCVISSNTVFSGFAVSFNIENNSLDTYKIFLYSEANESVIQEITVGPGVTAGELRCDISTGVALVISGTITATQKSVIGSLSSTAYPPTLTEFSYALNPAIPFHRLFFALPDTGDFACVVTARFELGGSIQNEVQVALGIISGRVFITPPSRPLECQILDAVFDPLIAEGGKIIENTSLGGSFITYKQASFEWTALADKVSFSFSSIQGSPTPIYVGNFQIPSQ